jgi:cytochrome P450
LAFLGATKASDTTALSVGSTLFFLALNSDCQNKALKEVDSILTGEETELSMEDLGKLRYLEMCWKEAMRLHCPVHFIGRRLTEAISLGKTFQKQF